MQKFPVVILPGWRIGSSRFDGLKEIFKNEGYPTFVIDFPGFETGLELTKAFHLIDYVKFLDKFLRQKRITKAIFVCHSFGGRVALKYLSQQPHLAQALIISGTPGFKVFRLRVLLTLLLAPVGKILIFVPPLFFFRKQLTQLLYRFSGTYDYYKTDGHLRQTFKNIIAESLLDYMKKIRIPTLLVWGEQDRVVPVGIANKMQKTILHSKIVTIAGENHNFVYKHPEKFSQPVLEFLKTL